MNDVIIVGARCAGASLAAFLGSLGHRVLLIDKYAEPGPTTSTHIIGESDVYRRLGVLERMESAGAPPMTRMRVEMGGTAFESDLFVTPRALGLRRELLDAYLCEAALRHPTVTPLFQTKVRSVLFEGTRAVGVQVENPDGTVSEHRARVVIGADGRSSLVARQVGAETLTQIDAHHHAVYYAYLTDLVPLPIPTVEWYWDDSDVILCNPIDQGMHCVVVMMPQAKADAWKPNLQDAFFSRLKQLKTLSSRLRGSELVGGLRGIGSCASFMKQPYGNGWALVGDAAAYLHPVSGVGIDNAVCSAEYLADRLHAYLTGASDWTDAMQGYAEQRDERIFPQYKALSDTLALTKQSLSEESEQSLRMLATFPSLMKKAGLHAPAVLTFLGEVSS